MRRFALLLVCIVLLSLPVLAGHTNQGDYCDDGTPGCISDGLLSRPVATRPVKHSTGGLSSLDIVKAFVIALRLGLPL